MSSSLYSFVVNRKVFFVSIHVWFTKKNTFNWTGLDICNIPIKELKNTETFPCVLPLFSIINSLIRPMGILVNVEDLE